MKKLTVMFAGVVLTVGFLGAAQAAEKHLIYAHGCCNKSLNDPKVKAYEKIVQNLRDSGFNVSFEMRTADQYDGETQALAFAEKIAGQVRGLLAKGVAPSDITVAGYSLGSRITLVASGLIANPRINYVLLAGCGNKETIPIDYAKVTGRVLSIRDAGDDKFGSCNGRLPVGATYKEIVLNSGEGHAVFRLADEKYLKLWKEPLVAWSRGE